MLLGVGSVQPLASDVCAARLPASQTNPSAACGCFLPCSYIGYRPGDPTAGPPPAAMPAPAVEPAAGSRVIDLRGMSMAQLMAEAATTHSRDFFAALLPNPPGMIRAPAPWPTHCAPAALALGRHGAHRQGRHCCKAALLPLLGAQQKACNSICACALACCRGATRAASICDGACACAGGRGAAAPAAAGTEGSATAAATASVASSRHWREDH